MQTPPIHELPYQDLTEEEKNVLGMWATQHPENIALAIQLCKGILKMSQKALMRKAGLSCIYGYGSKLGLWVLPPLTTLHLPGEIAYPFAGFANCPIPNKVLKITGSGVLDGNRDFFGLDKLPNLNVLSADENKESIFMQSENRKSTTIIKNGLKSLLAFPNLTQLINFKMDMGAVNDIQHLPKLAVLNICLSAEDIVPFFENIRSNSLQSITVNLNINDSLERIMQSHIYSCLRGIFERVPKCFGSPNPNSHNIGFRFDAAYHRFAENFNKIIYASLRKRNKKAPTD